MRKRPAPPPQERPEDFIAANLPRHKPIDALRTLIAAPPEAAATSFAEYAGAFVETADTTAARPTNLLDLYASDLRVIYQDMGARPDHYDDRQKEIVEMAMSGMDLGQAATDAEKDAILVAYMTRSVTKAERDDRVEKERKRQTEENEEIILEDGRTLADSLADAKSIDAAFDNPHPDDKIIV